jgi:hypothetical protein
MQEFHLYLEMLLNHRCQLDSGNCPQCRALQRIYEFMQTEIFSTVIYTETPRSLAQAAGCAAGRRPSAFVSRPNAGPES